MRTDEEWETSEGCIFLMLGVLWFLVVVAVGYQFIRAS